MISLASLILLVGAVGFLWRMFRFYITKSPLDNIAGPSSSSLLKGELIMYSIVRLTNIPYVVGDIPALFDRHGWDYHDSVAQRYGQVSRYHAPFGVRLFTVPSTRAHG